MKSIKSRKQRKELFNAPLHKRRKWISAHLEENLLLKYDKRGVPVIKGDTVRVMRGSFKGHEDKVAHVNIRRRQVEIEGMTMTKADNKKIAKPIHASNLMITKLNLTDKWRRNKLESGLSEETKKEIEKEAKEQIKEITEEEKRKAEEMEETPIQEPEEPAERIEENVKKTVEPEKSVEKKTTPKEKPKKEKVKKPKTEIKTTLKKPSERKKTPLKKETVKKYPEKTAKKEKKEIK